LKKRVNRISTTRNGRNPVAHGLATITTENSEKPVKRESDSIGDLIYLRECNYGRKRQRESRSENDGSIAGLNLGAPDCSQRDRCRLNPSTLRSLHQPQRYLLWRVRSLQTRSFQHFIWQAMQHLLHRRLQTLRNRHCSLAFLPAVFAPEKISMIRISSRSGASSSATASRLIRVKGRTLRFKYSATPAPSNACRTNVAWPPWSHKLEEAAFILRTTFAV